jgi:hypothetical protein
MNQDKKFLKEDWFDLYECWYDISPNNITCQKINKQKNPESKIILVPKNISVNEREEYISKLIKPNVKIVK